MIPTVPDKDQNFYLVAHGDLSPKKGITVLVVLFICIGWFLEQVVPGKFPKRYSWIIFVGRPPCTTETYTLWIAKDKNTTLIIILLYRSRGWFTFATQWKKTPTFLTRDRTQVFPYLSFCLSVAFPFWLRFQVFTQHPLTDERQNVTVQRRS
jgi:hypothetical protein